MAAPGTTSWFARGLLFENCVCQIVCPGHVHFDQLCTHERCLGYWAIVFEEGELEGVSLAGLRAVIAYDTPRHMIDGDWTQRLIVDTTTSPEQQQALERILAGEVGGPWTVLARFVAQREPTRRASIRIHDDGRRKQLRVEGIAEASVEPIRGRDRSQPVRLENMFNQIHAPSQVVARGQGRYDDGRISFETDGTHALYSSFSWGP